MTGNVIALHPEIEVALMPIAQEALANVARQAGATRAGLTLSLIGDVVTLDVRDDGVQFLGLNVKETNDQFAKAFVDRFGIEFPSLYDPRGEVALAFRGYPANAIPSTIVLDPEGRVAAVYTGTVTKADLRGVLDEILGEG